MWSYFCFRRGGADFNHEPDPLANQGCHTFGRSIILSSVAGPDANEDGVELLTLMTGGVAAVEVSVVLLVEVKDEGVEDR